MTNRNPLAATAFALALLAAAGCARSARPPATLPSARLDAGAPAPAGLSSAPRAPVTAAVAAAPVATAPVADTVLAAMDRSASPCQDFYRYACGNWLDTTSIPADRSRWGRGFHEIQERNNELLRTLLEEAGRDGERNPDQRKLGRYYAQCMDEAAIETAGLQPLGELFARIDAVRDAASLLAVAGVLQAHQVSPLLEIGIYADPKDPATTIAHFFQGGLGMPDRDYYLREDADSRKMLADYQSHVQAMLGHAGVAADGAAREAAAVVAFETELARLSRPREELRDPDKTYHKLDRKGLQALSSALPWDDFFAAAGHPGVRAINVATPEFFTGLGALAAKTDASTLRAYLRWHLVHGFASLLPRAIQEEDFAFFGRRLNGQKQIQPRWKRCVNHTDGALGELLGQAFVARRFAGTSKATALEMIQGIEAAFADNLPGLSWMDDTTRRRALEKLGRITNKIGYPDRWRDYSRLAIADAGWFQTGVAARRFEFDRQLNKVGQPVDRGEWGMTPPTVNAYYNPLNNEIAFPAGIMQPPFFDASFPAPMNFGGIGMVMGHEVTHGFDDEGRKFDAGGRLTEWWEPQAARRFEKAAQCVDDLYEGYEVAPGLHLNGKLTLGENIADLGGLKQAFLAWRRWARQHGEPPPAVPGLSNDQLFFVAFAQTWCTLSTPEVDRVLVTVDPHSPPRFRVNGPVANSSEFARAFSCPKGSAMNPERSCVVW